MDKPIPITSFLDVFMSKFAPSGMGTVTVPYVRTGIIRNTHLEDTPFVVTETHSSYYVEMDGEKKKFSNALDAAKWIKLGVRI